VVTERRPAEVVFDEALERVNRAALTHSQGPTEESSRAFDEALAALMAATRFVARTWPGGTAAGRRAGRVRG
jgi:hypothetical protein